MAYYWDNPGPNWSMRLPYANDFMSWGPPGFTAPRGGANWPPAANYQPLAPPGAQAMPAGPAPAVMPNTGLAPAGLPAQQTGSLAPADPATYYNINAATPAPPGSHPSHGDDRAQGVAAAPYANHDAVVAPTRAATPNQPSRAAAATADVATPGAAAAPTRQANVAVGDARALPLPAEPPEGPVEHEDAANQVDDETVVGEDDDNDAATMLDDEEEFWTVDDDDEEFWTDDDEDDEQPVRYVEPVLRPVFNWD